jgi:hypothetical protein
MANETVDMDIDKYSVGEILSFFNIVDPTVFNVTDAANSIIAKMTAEGKTDLVGFFAEARDKVLTYLQNLGKEPVENERSEDISSVWKSAFRDNGPNPTRYFDSPPHVVADHKGQTLRQANEPLIATYIVNIDSQYRTNILPYLNSPLSNAYNTNYTFNLSGPIDKAISMALYSYQIPTTWYAFSAQVGNTFFLYNGVIITIPDGNYTEQIMVDTINGIAQQNSATNGLVVAYNKQTNRISFTNTDPLLGTVTVIFFIQSNVATFVNCGNYVVSNFQSMGVNTTLGWLLGFRTPQDTTTGDVVLFLEPNITAIADVAPDTYGPKYFNLSIEDYKNQRLSRGLYNITNTKNYATMSIPDYYSTIDVACKLREGSLTQAQQYAINAVTQSATVQNSVNTASGFNNRLPAPNIGAAFAVIPLVDIRNTRPDPYIRFGEDLTYNKRKYLMPTNLERLTVTLTDDKGYLVNLYDNEWSFSLIIEERLN